MGFTEVLTMVFIVLKLIGVILAIIFYVGLFILVIGTRIKTDRR